MPVKVKTVKGKTYNIHCDPQEMGYKLGLHIGPETSAVIGQRILHQGRDILEDQTLSEQGIDHTTTLTRIRLFEKYSPKFNPALEPIQTLEIMCENGQSFGITAFGKETVDQLKASTRFPDLVPHEPKHNLRLAGTDCQGLEHAPGL